MMGNCVEIICLPLYSESPAEGKFVQPRNNVNMWNAAGRQRNENEVEIALPIKFRQFFPYFFPTGGESFELRLPNYVSINCKVTKDGRVLTSNPSKDLGKWLLRQVLRLSTGTLVTYEILEKKGIDALYFEKWIDGSSVYYKVFPAPVGEYEKFVRSGIKERIEIPDKTIKGRFGSARVESSHVIIAENYDEVSVGEIVVHKAFGKGIVKSYQNDMVELDFAGTVKSFKYSWLLNNKMIKKVEKEIV